MPTVNDTARITTRDGAVWRTCAGCGLLAPMPADVDRYPACNRPASAPADHAARGWELAHRYVAALGRIQAWAVLIPHVTDAERLAKIRQALTVLNPECDGGQQ